MDETTEPTNEDNFAAAFDRLADLGTEARPEEVAAAAEAPAEAPAVETPAEPSEPVAETPVEPAPTAEPPQMSDEELLARFAQIAQQQVAQPVAQQVAQPVAQEPAQQPQDFLSTEDRQFLTDYEKDWPDVARAEQLRRQVEYRQLLGYVFNEVASHLKPVMETVRTLSERTHYTDLTNTVSDYDTVRDNVVSWVDKQPAYLQPAYKHVIQNGTVDEVADLIDRYRRDSGATLQQSQQQAAPVARKSEPELPTATKQAAAALAPVSSKRSAVIQTDDPNDFESAFQSFASKL